MRKTVLVLVCLSCVGYGRRVQSSAAFNPANVGAHSPSIFAGSRLRQDAPQMQVPNAVEGTPYLFVYDHCPFCVRVRLALGALDAPHRLVFLENDDVETPTALIGKKIAPIWVDNDGAMAESLDIIAKVDTQKKIAPASGRKDIKAWQKSVQTLMRKLQRPRYVKMMLPEFMKKAGRDAFVSNHQMPPYEKKDWKGNPNFLLSTKYEKYEEAFRESHMLLPQLNAKLQELAPLIHSAEACTPGIGFSYDDIDLWARLRSLTVIKGVVLPSKVRAYLDHFEKVGDVPLYDGMAV